MNKKENKKEKGENEIFERFSPLGYRISLIVVFLILLSLIYIAYITNGKERSLKDKLSIQFEVYQQFDYNFNQTIAIPIEYYCLATEQDGKKIFVSKNDKFLSYQATLNSKKNSKDVSWKSEEEIYVFDAVDHCIKLAIGRKRNVELGIRINGDKPIPYSDEMFYRVPLSDRVTLAYLDIVNMKNNDVLYALRIQALSSIK